MRRFVRRRGLTAPMHERAHSSGRLPSLFRRDFDSAPPGVWMYTRSGNYPALVRNCRKTAALETMPQCCKGPRSAVRLRSAHSEGISCPRVFSGTAEPPAGGDWLLKPHAGAGGSGIRVWDGRPPSKRKRPTMLFPGENSRRTPRALYIGDGQTARLLGVTRQLVGESWLHAGHSPTGQRRSDYLGNAFTTNASRL